MSELRIVRAEGNPVQRGQRIGRELRDLMNESIDFYGRYMSRRGVSTQQLQELLTPYLVYAEAAFPQFMATLNGMSAGATVPFLELFAVNAFEELEPLLEAPEGGTLFLQRKEGSFPTKEPRDQPTVEGRLVIHSAAAHRTARNARSTSLETWPRNRTTNGGWEAWMGKPTAQPNARSGPSGRPPAAGSSRQRPSNCCER